MYEKPNTNQSASSGLALLRDRALNHGTGFAEAERDKYNLRGFLPPHVQTQEEQAIRVLSRIREVSAHIAAAVAQTAYKKGLTAKARPADVLADVRSRMYDPKY